MLPLFIIDLSFPQPVKILYLFNLYHKFKLLLILITAHSFILLLPQLLKDEYLNPILLHTAV